MYRLAKLGFSQSYTYFTWRNTKQELTEYFSELTQTEVREYFRPNLWPNTPDILPEFLQVGGRPAFMIRLILAATLGASYGIYGPAFELCENAPFQPGSEEYLNSEKYELKHRDLNSAGSLKDFIARINRIRKENPALQSNRNLRFHETDNPALICYSKATDDLSDVIVVIVNLDCFHAQTGWIHLDLGSLGLDADHAFQVHDLLGEGRYLWQGSRNYVELDAGKPAGAYSACAPVGSDGVGFRLLPLGPWKSVYQSLDEKKERACAIGPERIRPVPACGRHSLPRLRKARRSPHGEGWRVAACTLPCGRRMRSWSR